MNGVNRRTISSSRMALLAGAAVFFTFGETRANAQSAIHADAASAEHPGAGSTAAPPAPMEDDEIIVTARKRSESIQDVPLSVTAVGEAQLERYDIQDLEDLATLAPNVTIRAPTISPTNIAPYIRGIGSRSNDPSQDVPIAISIDGVYLSQIAGSLIDIFDAQQVEILRGPQGTLQGRNSPGGAINVTTRRPTEDFSARGQISYGSYNEFHAKASVSGALLPGTVAARVSVFRDSGGGYLKSLTTGQRFGGQDSVGGRIGLLVTPDDNVTLYLTADYLHDRTPQPAMRPVPVAQAFPRQPIPIVCANFGFCTPYPEYRNGATYTPPGRSDNGGFGAVLDWDLGAATLTSVTGYRYVNEHTWSDLDALPAAIFSLDDRAIKTRTFSQELRLASDGNAPLSYVVGAYFLRSRFDLTEPVTFNGRTSTTLKEQVAKSFALFGQASYRITDRLSASAGIRQTWDQKDVDMLPAGVTIRQMHGRKWNNLSLEAGAEYKLNQDSMAYIRYSEGYRSGGINNGTARNTAIDAYDPETVRSYEIGLKTEWFDRKLLINASAFQSDYQDLQVNVTVDASFRAVRNAASARIRGVELETVARLSPNLSLTASAGYLDPKYRKFVADIIGNGIPTDNSALTLPYTSKWTGNAAIDYRLPILPDAGALEIGVDVQYRSQANYTSVTQTQVGIQPAMALLNASIAYVSPDERYKVSIFGKNLTDKYYINTGEVANGAFMWQIVGAPRTFGVRLQVTY